MKKLFKQWINMLAHYMFCESNYVARESKEINSVVYEKMLCPHCRSFYWRKAK